MGEKFATKSVHFTSKTSGEIASKVTPIYQTSAFKFNDLEDIERFYQGEKDYLYSRVGNPNTDELGSAVAQLEEAPAGIATSSGLSAILIGILSVTKAGDHVIASTDIYGGTYELFARELANFGIEVSFIDFTDQEAIKTGIQTNTKLLYSESITNPLLRVENMEQLVHLAKQNNLYTMIDNTFATPYLLQPYHSGIDLVVHSATKYLGGHSDVTAGVLVGDADLLAKAKTKVVNIGTTLSPFEAWLTCRGLKTLDVRMERQVKNAQALADAFVTHPAVSKVYYPTHASKKGNGAIVSIDLSGKCDIEKFFRSLDWVKIVPTLAGVETTVSYPRTTSHRALPIEVQEELAITEGLVRISVGIEDSADIIGAFEQAIIKAKYE
ncbi:cystathionine gamma-synthase [Natronobacillus azotifigens]|uniref:homocysteine desulfhydrase n=1 Tax=Natronobacillus azotifigens TaxID=472978 RepID=A0A9J6R8S7_9BACI|nr:aminotransferase class I/II-fold pyridoxal phosphate-dependent enzyme [Natronobacillus azotifigens]MCZ0702066.1 aminotransferase class I/II-fold pyridoxal phosphate-dependent enzyme [Natronobacillus azotifigens]